MLGPGASRDERSGERSGCCCTSLAAAPNMSEKSMASGGSSRTPSTVATTDMTISLECEGGGKRDEAECEREGYALLCVSFHTFTVLCVSFHC